MNSIVNSLSWLPSSTKTIRFRKPTLGWTVLIVLLNVIAIYILLSPGVSGYILSTYGNSVSIGGTTNSYYSIGGGTSNWIVVRPAVPGTGEDPYGNSTSPVWTLVRVLPYIFVGICLLGSLAFLGVGNPIAGVILAVLGIVVGIIGVGIIQYLIP